ncbi:unnamed protein product [Linum tenue]|uniref:Cytochrome P450 n=1 Tax=Linum tenue TaxID=586396 RepID=A0AAV0GTB7_9ROSI|nr:unnamed protein product [Linum tenue]
MIKNPRVLHKAQQEVRQVFGDDCDEKNAFGEAGLHRLKYLDMVIAESFRLHPPGPLLAPRENRDQRVELNSYDEVPVNSYVIVNAWAINRDPRYWTEAERFFPERFMDRSIDYTGNDFQFIPFGAGRRMCPGNSFRMAIVKITLANLLFHFDWTLPAERAVNRDPRYWTEPEKFYPERFMNCSIDYQGNDFRFIPFGAGRRICPGASFGMAVVKITLASLLSNFDWTLPDDMKSIDMTECFEATLKRQYALLLIPVLRPPALN